MIYCPYTYHIAWSKHNIHYYGVRLARKQPNDLWVKYFTSSKYVKNFRSLYGEPDVVEIRKEFSTETAAKLWEKKVLTRLKVRINNNWLNRYDYTFNGSTKPKPPGHGKKVSEALRGVPKSTEHKKHLSDAIKGSFTWATDKVENKQIRVCLLDKFLTDNPTWRVGYSTSNETRKKQSNTRKRLIEEGKVKIPDNTNNIPWNKGLTKETSLLLQEISEKISLRTKGIHKGKSTWNKGKTYSFTKKKIKMRWINDGECNKQIKDADSLPEGFVFGRIVSWSTKSKDSV